MWPRLSPNASQSGLDWSSSSAANSFDRPSPHQLSVSIEHPAPRGIDWRTLKAYEIHCLQARNNFEMSHLKRSTRCKFAALVLAIGLALGRADAQVLNNATASSPQQQQPPNSLQVHLNQIQQQVQRQLNQFNGLIMANSAANNSAASQRSNVLEAISNIGKVVHQQISAATNPNHVNIVTGGGGGLTSSQLNGPQLEFANSKKVSSWPSVATPVSSRVQFETLPLPSLTQPTRRTNINPFRWPI